EVTLYFHPNHTGKGHGKKVMLFLENLAKQHQIVNLIGVITEENINSVKLFERCGYFIAAHLKKVGVKFDRALDVTWYQKEI
ncbi:MAG: GNAT family N-acetyltransferase, partial [Vicingaceae bacterium]|nr:GNAT family N-acetyltransferase [Vicingaceae bacterium]